MQLSVANAMSSLRALVAGQKVLIVGSAPSAIFPSYVDQNWVILCVNGSFKSLPESYMGHRVGLIADFEQLIGKPKNPSRVSAREGWSQVVNAGVFGITSNRLGMSSPDFALDEALETQFRGRIRLGQMRRILYRQTSVPQIGSWPWGQVSTGFKAIALALHAGAYSVSVTGFSLSEKSPHHHGGHSYVEDDDPADSNASPRPRSHSAGDTLLLSALACRGEKRVVSLEGNLDFALRSYFHEPRLPGVLRSGLTRVLYSLMAPW